MYATYKPVEILEIGQTVGTGWLPPLPDLCDFTDAESEIAGVDTHGLTPVALEIRTRNLIGA